MERVLRFKVNGQLIEKDPSCDFAGLTPGTNGYLTAEFDFSREWDGCVKVVGFRSGNNEYEPKVLRVRKDGQFCTIDEEVLKRPMFYIYVVGKKGDYRIKTNEVLINQNGGA